METPKLSLSDCVIWPGPKRKDGYGRVFVDGKRVYAHRVAYCKARGIPLSAIKGIVIRHRCDNPPCVSDAHLIAGRQTDNIADMIERGRNVACEKHGRAKLTDAQVSEMRGLFTGARGQVVALAKRFKVSHSMVSLIVRDHNWRRLVA